MSDQIIGLQDWLQTPPGRYLLDWERTQMDRAVADMFGYHALQLGLPTLAGLQHNRMPHRWLATQEMPASPPGAELNMDVQAGTPDVPLAFITDFDALPFPAASLDLVVLPHTLELSNAHETLREVERVLVPEGRVVICGLNPASLWGLAQKRGHLYRRLGFGSLFLPDGGEFIGYWRLRDWLRLLGFEVQVSRFAGWTPALGSERWMQRLGWMDAMGGRWWPILGGVYLLMATKRVPAGRLIDGRRWRTVRSTAPATVPAARSETFMGQKPDAKDIVEPR